MYGSTYYPGIALKDALTRHIFVSFNVAPGYCTRAPRYCGWLTGTRVSALKNSLLVCKICAGGTAGAVPTLVVGADFYFSSSFCGKKIVFLSSRLLHSVSSTSLHTLYFNVTAVFRSKVRALFE